MKIQTGVGNSIVPTFSAAAKTVAFAGLSNWDIDPGSLSIYNVTRSAWMLGDTATATATIARTYSSGLTVQTITLSSIPASSADGDTILYWLTVPDNVALYLCLLEIIP